MKVDKCDSCIVFCPEDLDFVTGGRKNFGGGRPVTQ